MPGSHIFVMFLRASDASSRVLAFLEQLAHPSDLGYDEVHAELLVGDMAYAAVYTGGHCVVAHRFRHLPVGAPMLEIVPVPVTSLARAGEFAEAMRRGSRATYEIPYAEFALPSFLVHDLGDDPVAWDHLYCSQFVLLFLRACARAGVLDLPRDRLAPLLACNSVQCSPAHLRRLLRLVLCA